MAGDRSEREQTGLRDGADSESDESLEEGDESSGVESGEGEAGPRTIHDGFFKKVFSQPENAASALRAVTPEKIAKQIDWSSLQPDHGSMSSDRFRQLHCDLLFKARWVAGDELFLHVISEHQSTVDRWMILRGLAMVQAVWERHRERNKTSRHLPAVLMYVLYHGATPWNAPTSLDEVIRVPDEVREELRPFLPSFRFVLDDLHVASDESIAAREMAPYPKLCLVMLEIGRGEEFAAKLRFHGRTINALLQMEGGDILLEILVRYLWLVNPGVDAENLEQILKPIIGPEAENIMMTFAQRLRKEGLDEGMDKGMKKGMEKGQRELLLALIRQRFEDVPAEIEARIARARVETLHRWAMRVLDAGSLDEVFEDS